MWTAGRATGEGGPGEGRRGATRGASGRAGGPRTGRWRGAAIRGCAPPGSIPGRCLGVAGTWCRRAWSELRQDKKASEWGARRFPQRVRRLRAVRGRGRTGVRRRVRVSDQLCLAIAHKLLNDARVGDVPMGLELRPHLEPLADEQVAVHRPVLQALEPLPVQPLHADHVRGAAHAEPWPSGLLRALLALRKL